jgi:hypothetical protein
MFRTLGKDVESKRHMARVRLRIKYPYRSRTELEKLDGVHKKIKAGLGGSRWGR